MRWAALLLCTTALCATAACTIATGAPPDAAPCAPSRDFFVSDIYPRYFVPNQCGSSGCHSFDDGHGVLRLRTLQTPAPTPGLPLEAWDPSWRETYLSAIHLVRCDAPLESRLLTVPEGLGNLHPPGPVVLDRATAATLLETWVARP
ncbi:MAG: hypothetical protein JWN44_5028 [Myxococcales bacterium]|nr:hypothetical protein [Myxococcales bacterium]